MGNVTYNPSNCFPSVSLVAFIFVCTGRRIAEEPPWLTFSGTIKILLTGFLLPFVPSVHLITHSQSHNTLTGSVIKKYLCTTSTICHQRLCVVEEQDIINPWSMYVHFGFFLVSKSPPPYPQGFSWDVGRGTLYCKRLKPFRRSLQWEPHLMDGKITLNKKTSLGYCKGDCSNSVIYMSSYSSSFWVVNCVWQHTLKQRSKETDAKKSPVETSIFTFRKPRRTVMQL